MKKEFKQSLFQHVFSSVYELGCYVLWELGIVLILIVALPMFEFDLTPTYSLMMFAYVLGRIAFMYFKGHQGGAKTLTFDADGICFEDSNVVSDIPWAKLESFRITRYPPYQIVLNNSVFGKTRFSYYAFSSAQRTEIVSLLNDSVGNKVE